MAKPMLFDDFAEVNYEFRWNKEKNAYCFMGYSNRPLEQVDDSTVSWVRVMFLKEYQCFDSINEAIRSFSTYLILGKICDCVDDQLKQKMMLADMVKEDIFSKSNVAIKPTQTEIETGQHPDLKGGKFDTHSS